jgi:hypothetical protein
MNTTNFFLWDDTGKKDLAIVKHYLMYYLDKKTWDTMRGNYRKWNPTGVAACMFKTILKMHHLFIKDDDSIISDSSKISMRLHHRAIRDYYEESVEDLEKEIDDLKNDDKTMLISEHKHEIRVIEQEHKHQMEDLERENQKLKNQLQFQIEKRQHHDGIMAQREAHLNKQIDLLASTSD